MKSHIRAVVFDAYGTLVDIQKKLMPYRKLLAEAARCHHTPDDASQLIMSRPLELVDAALALGLDVTDVAVSGLLDGLKIDLQAEIDSITLFPDVPDTIDKLRSAGLMVAVCSNLALPYAEPVLMLTGMHERDCIWSFNVAAIKPMNAMYASVCKKLDVSANEVLFVGDTRNADVLGPRLFGMEALHLVRSEASNGRDQIQSLHEVLDYFGLEV